MISFPWISNDNRKSFIKKIIQRENLNIRLIEDSVLSTIYYYITRSCNLSCSHCWVSANSEFLFTEPCLSLSTVIGFITEAISLGLKKIKITGGEPLLDHKILDLIKYLSKETNLEIEIETNGTLMNTTIVKVLSELKKVFISISLDGLTEESNNFLRKGSVLSIVLHTIEQLHQSGIIVSINTVLHRQNLNEIESLIAYSEKLKIKNHRFIISLQKIGRGKNCENDELSWEEIVKACIIIYGLKMRGYNQINLGTSHSTLPPALQPLEILDYKNCGWGTSLCGILSNGDISICGGAYESLSLIAGNVKDGLSKIWLESPFFKKLRSIKPIDYEGICGNCLFSGLCRGMCRINAFATYGKLTSPYPLCQLAYENGSFPEDLMISPLKDCSIKK